MTPIAHYCNSKYIHGKINELNINKNTGKRHYSPVLLVYKAQTHTLPYLNNLDYHAQHQGSPFILENFFCPLVYTFFSEKCSPILLVVQVESIFDQGLNLIEIANNKVIPLMLCSSDIQSYKIHFKIDKMI